MLFDQALCLYLDELNASYKSQLQIQDAHQQDLAELTAALNQEQTKREEAQAAHQAVLSEKSRIVGENRSLVQRLETANKPAPGGHLELVFIFSIILAVSQPDGRGFFSPDDPVRTDIPRKSCQLHHAAVPNHRLTHPLVFSMQAYELY